MMNRKFIIGLIILAALLSTAFFFLIPKSPQLSNNYNLTIEKDEDTSEVIDLFSEAFSGRESVKCTFNQSGNVSAVYVKKGKIRIDSMGMDGAQYGNAIIDGNMVYVWQMGNNEGIMIDTSNYKSANGGIPDQVMNAEKIKQEVEKSKPTCIKETIDDAVFIPPSSVIFTDYSSMMQKVQPSGAMTQE